MSSNAVELLREHDPASGLVDLDERSRQAHCDEILAHSVWRRRTSASRPVRRFVQTVAVLAATLAFGVGVAWASGLLSPLALFETNAQRDGNPAGSVWDQSVLPASVRQISSVQIPKVGAVSFWYGKTTEGGW